MTISLRSFSCRVCLRVCLKMFFLVHWAVFLLSARQSALCVWFVALVIRFVTRDHAHFGSRKRSSLSSSELTLYRVSKAGRRTVDTCGVTSLLLCDKTEKRKRGTETRATLHDLQKHVNKREHRDQLELSGHESSRFAAVVSGLAAPWAGKPDADAQPTPGREVCPDSHCQAKRVWKR